MCRIVCLGSFGAFKRSREGFAMNQINTLDSILVFGSFVSAGIVRP